MQNETATCSGTAKIELPDELYTKELLSDGRTVTTCTMRQQILHCIGMVDSCAHKPYTRHGKKFYRPWRNYFTTNQLDAEWDKLCEAGYAAHGNVSDSGVTYWMTRAGLDWLGEALEVHIYDESN